MALFIQRLVPNFCLCIGQCNTSKNDGLPVANVYAIIFFYAVFFDNREGGTQYCRAFFVISKVFSNQLNI